MRTRCFDAARTGLAMNLFHGHCTGGPNFSEPYGAARPHRYTAVLQRLFQVLLQRFGCFFDVIRAAQMRLPHTVRVVESRRQLLKLLRGGWLFSFLLLSARRESLFGLVVRRFRQVGRRPFRCLAACNQIALLVKRLLLAHVVAEVDDLFHDHVQADEHTRPTDASTAHIWRRGGGRGTAGVGSSGA